MELAAPFTPNLVIRALISLHPRLVYYYTQLQNFRLLKEEIEVFKKRRRHYSINRELLRVGQEKRVSKEIETLYLRIRDSATKINGHKCHDSEIGAK